MKKLNEKGFTLVELLVALTVLGIILAIALPQVTNIQHENTKTKYKKYAESIVSGAKLYTDSYSKDMFGNNSSGCYDIPFSDLKSKSLAKDIKLDSSTCDTYGADNKTSLTYVRVYKSNENFLYDVAIKCNDKNGKEVYKEELEKDICDGTRLDTEGPKIIIEVNSAWTTGKDSKGTPLQATVTAKDPYGLKENVQLEYAWTKTPDTITGLSFKTKAFTNNREKLVQEVSFKVDYPQNENGTWYLIVRPAGEEGLRDANGNYYSGGYEKSAPVNLDNTKPQITEKANNKDSVWTNSNVTISATATDAHSGVKKIYYTYSNSNASSGLKDDWKIKTPSGKNLSVSSDWSAERNSNIYLIAEDNVGNQSVIVAAGKVMIDKTGPTCTSTGGNATWTNGSRTLIGTCTDSGSGCKTATITKSYTTNTNSTTQSPGTVYDNAGNSTVCPANQTVKIDKTSPTCTSSGGNASWTNGSRTITGTCSDTGGSGCKTATITKSYTTNTNSTTQSPGTVYDNAGNSAVCPANQTVKIDKTAPTCTSSGEISGWTNGNRTITGTCSDTGGSGCKTTTISKTYTTDINSTKESPGTVYDNAGNSKVCPSNQTVKIDKTKPYTPYHPSPSDNSTNRYGSGGDGKTVCFKNYDSNCHLTTKTTQVTCTFSKVYACGGTSTAYKDNTGGSGYSSNKKRYKCARYSSSFTGTKKLNTWSSWMNSSDLNDYYSKHQSEYISCKENRVQIKIYDNAGNESAVYQYNINQDSFVK